jgi:hypothetical protein
MRLPVPPPAAENVDAAASARESNRPLKVSVSRYASKWRLARPKVSYRYAHISGVCAYLAGPTDDILAAAPGQPVVFEPVSLR